MNAKEILILGASPRAYEILQFYFKWFDKRRVENKIKSIDRECLELKDKLDFLVKNMGIEKFIIDNYDKTISLITIILAAIDKYASSKNYIYLEPLIELFMRVYRYGFR